MNKTDIRKLLVDYPTTINLTGREDFLKQLYIKYIVDFYVPKDSVDNNLIYLDGGKRGDIISILQEYPQFSDYRVVIIKGDVSDYSNVKSRFTILISYDGKIKQCDLFIECNRLYGVSLTNFVKKSFKEEGIVVKSEYIKQIVYSDNDLNRVLCNVRKISLLHDINKDNINVVLSFFADAKFDDLMSSIVRSDSSLALSKYYLLLNSGYTNSQIVGYISWFISKVFEFNYSGITYDESNYLATKFIKYGKVLDSNFLNSTLYYLVELYRKMHYFPEYVILFILGFSKRSYINAI